MPTQRPRKRPFPWFAIALVILSTLFVVGIVFLLRDSSTSPAVELAAENDAPNLPYPEIARISVDDARERLDSDETVFVDVRGADQYAAAHIAGAISIPLDALEARSRDLAKDSEIITYCT
jgi:3-mercaptopyruvate sulfurtransferase SseA